MTTNPNRILRREFRRIARWWELEAARGYPSAESSCQYARNYRWLVELMDAGRRVTANAHGVYIDGELASVVAERGRRAEERATQRAERARKEAERSARTI